MKVVCLGLALLSVATLIGCQSEEVTRKAQVRETLLLECQQTVQLMVQGGLGNYPQLCPCVATQFDAMPIEQFRQISANPMAVMQFKQQLNAQCMQQAGVFGSGVTPPGMQPGIQPGIQPGAGFGGAAKGADEAAASNSAN